MEKLLNIEEAAALLNISVKSIYGLTCAKRIPYVKIGSRVLFDPDEIKAWVEGQKIKPIKDEVKSV